MDDVISFFLGLFLLLFGITTRKWSKPGLLISSTYGLILLGSMVVMIQIFRFLFKPIEWLSFLALPLALIITVMTYLKDRREKED